MASLNGQAVDKNKFGWINILFSTFAHLETMSHRIKDPQKINQYLVIGRKSMEQNHNDSIVHDVIKTIKRTISHFKHC